MALRSSDTRRAVPATPIVMAVVGKSSHSSRACGVESEVGLASSGVLLSRLALVCTSTKAT